MNSNEKGACQDNRSLQLRSETSRNSCLTRMTGLRSCRNPLLDLMLGSPRPVRPDENNVPSSPLSQQTLPPGQSCSHLPSTDWTDSMSHRTNSGTRLSIRPLASNGRCAWSGRCRRLWRFRRHDTRRIEPNVAHDVALLKQFLEDPLTQDSKVLTKVKPLADATRVLRSETDATERHTYPMFPVSSFTGARCLDRAEGWPVVCQYQAPTIQISQKTMDVLETQHLDTVVDVLVVMQQQLSWTMYPQCKCCKVRSRLHGRTSLTKLVTFGWNAEARSHNPEDSGNCVL